MGAPVLRTLFPDFTSATRTGVAVAPASLFTGTRWTPSLASGTDYVLDLLTNNPGLMPATGGINVQHGRHVLIQNAVLSQSGNGGPNVYIAGGDQTRKICMVDCVVDQSAFGESDGIRSHTSPIDPANTTLMMLHCLIADLRGQSYPQGGASTTLNGAITNASSSIVVASDSAAPPTPFTINIGGEVIAVGNNSTLNTFSSLTRGMYPGTAAASHSNGATVDYSDDYGGVTLGTHADAVQLPGGLGALYMESCTVTGRYSCLQLQHEHTESGSYLGSGIINATDPGVTGGRRRARYTFLASHGRSVGDWLQVGKGVAAGGSNLSPSGWNGTYHVVAIVSPTVLDVDFGPNSSLGCTVPGTFTTGGTAKLSDFTNTIGDIWLNRVNMRALVNTQQYLSGNPAELINALRFGGRPDFKAFADRTPLLVEGVGDGISTQPRTVTLDEVYVQTLSGGSQDLGDIINPGNGSTIYGEGKATITGVTPNRVLNWPNYPGTNPIVDLDGNVGQILEGVPHEGDYAPRTRIGWGAPRVLLGGRIT